MNGILGEGNDEEWLSLNSSSRTMGFKRKGVRGRKEEMDYRLMGKRNEGKK